MAKTTTAGPNFREIMTSIKKGKFVNVYLLMGEEPYYIDQLAKALENHVVAEEDKDFNLDTFYGADSEVASVVGSAAQFPVMADRKLVMLKEAQSLDKAASQLDKLAPYALNPTPTTVLVITYKKEPLGATSKLVKAIKQAGGIVFVSPKLKDWQLPTPVKEYCNSLKIRIDDKAVALLCEYIGSPLSKLFGEIDKLVVAGGQETAITPELIEKNIGISKEFNSFELKSALAVKNYSKAMGIVDYFSKNTKNNPVVMIIPALYDFVYKLVVAHSLADKSDRSLMDALEVKTPYQLTDVKNGLANYSYRQAIMVLHALRALDCKSKGINSFQNEYELLKEFIFIAMSIK